MSFLVTKKPLKTTIIVFEKLTLSPKFDIIN